MNFQLFPAFFDHPANISFAEQEDDEVLELFLRQHPFVNVYWIITSLIAIVLPVILIQLDTTLRLNVLTSIPSSLIAASLVIYYLLVLGYVIEQFLHWYFNIYGSVLHGG